MKDKRYDPKKMVKNSQYQKTFSTLSEEINDDVYHRIEELIEKKKGYFDKGN